MSHHPFLVLIVDDNPKNIQLLANQLKPEGYHISFAQNGYEALERARSQMPDLILLDVMMPGMDGFDVCKELKASESTSSIPIIFLTAKTEVESTLQAFELGANDYVTKPFNNLEMLYRVRTQLRLKRAIEDLAEANRLKDKFFSIIAHDLKNPFNALAGTAHFLLTRFGNLTDEEKRKHLSAMHKGSKTALEMIEQLLRWARSQSGQIRFEPRAFDLFGLGIKIQRHLEAQAKEKNIHLELDMIKPCLVYADQDMVELMLRNLLSNGIKFTQRGGKVSLATEKEGEWVRVVAADTGIGMNTEDLTKLFRLDVHFSQFGTENEEGSGLGLILCQEFALKHGAFVEVESEEGKGSQFSFALPGNKEALQRSQS